MDMQLYQNIEKGVFQLLVIEVLSKLLRNKYDLFLRQLCRTSNVQQHATKLRERRLFVATTGLRRSVIVSTALIRWSTAIISAVVLVVVVVICA
jgi:hypothetical protein